MSLLKRDDPVFFPLILLFIETDEDRQFFESVYLDYHRLMYAQALQITRSAQDALDAVSDSMLSLIKKIDLLRAMPCNKLRSYVVITVKHHAINRYNRKKREQPMDDSAFSIFPGSDRVEDGLMAQAGVEHIKNCIASLPAREKEIIMMRYFRELTDEEIAAEMGIRAVSVRVHLSRARKHLSELLAAGREYHA